MGKLDPPKYEFENLSDILTSSESDFGSKEEFDPIKENTKLKRQIHRQNYILVAVVLVVVVAFVVLVVDTLYFHISNHNFYKDLSDKQNSLEVKVIQMETKFLLNNEEVNRNPKVEKVKETSDEDK